MARVSHMFRDQTTTKKKIVKREKETIFDTDSTSTSHATQRAPLYITLLPFIIITIIQQQQQQNIQKEIVIMKTWKANSIFTISAPCIKICKRSACIIITIIMRLFVYERRFEILLAPFLQAVSLRKWNTQLSSVQYLRRKDKIGCFQKFRPKVVKRSLSELSRRA